MPIRPATPDDNDTDVPPNFEQIEQAAARIQPFVHATPVLTSSTINRLARAELVFKCENFQRIGAFKARGAHNAILGLPPAPRRRNIITHSSGNHAAAVALAARSIDADAIVVMPDNSSRVKIAAVERLGGRIVFCQPTTAAREATTEEWINKTDATLVHPFDNWDVIAGQGTAALELVRQVRGVQAILTPVGGGGLLAGSSIVGIHSAIQVIGTEPKQVDDAYRSLAAGTIQPLSGTQTIADGLRTTLGSRPFQLIRRNVGAILTVTEESIIRAMRLLWEILKIVVEPSAAVPLAAVLESRDQIPVERIGIILSGGNVDLDRLPWN